VDNKLVIVHDTIRHKEKCSSVALCIFFQLNLSTIDEAFPIFVHKCIVVSPLNIILHNALVHSKEFLKYNFLLQL